MSKNYLFVVAHPDDEVLGAGATMYDLAKQGNNVYVCCLSCECNTRVDELVEGLKKSHKILGVKDCFLGSYKCLCFKDEPHEEMVQFVEYAIKQSKADVVFTHHPTDLNNDHYITSLICQEAVRLPQRQIGYDKKIENVLFMEVQSETDWHLNNAWDSFKPNTYQQVSSKAVSAKIKALAVYDNVIRATPHPRSKRNIKALAAIRGSEGGYENAEAFQSIFRLGV